MSSHCPTYLLLALTLTALGGDRPAHAQDQYIYWIGAVQAEETRSNAIFRYALDTGIVDTLVQAKDLGPEEKRYLYYVTVDTLHRQIYWTDSGGVFPDGVHYLGAIMRASLDGDNPEIFLGGGLPTSEPFRRFPTPRHPRSLGVSLYWRARFPGPYLNRYLEDSEPDQTSPYSTIRIPCIVAKCPG